MPWKGSSTTSEFAANMDKMPAASLYYGISYLDIKGQQLRDAGVTIGYGVNSFKHPFGVNVALELGQRGTQQNGLIHERYVNFTFTLSYRDFWLTKGRKYD